MQGREMHWLRIDRYFVESKNAEAVFQPICVNIATMPLVKL